MNKNLTIKTEIVKKVVKTETIFLNQEEKTFI